MTSSASAPADAAAPSEIPKPDFGAARRHFIFQDHHDALRESIRRFVVSELAPHAEEWEETTFPDSVFVRRPTAGRAATTSRTSCSPRR